LRVNLLEVLMLFLILSTLAAIPSASVALVVTRSATFGVANGIAVAAGIVLADLLFIALVLLGLTVLAETMGGFFMLVRYAGALYLVWLGVALLRAGSGGASLPQVSGHGGGLLESGLAGFLLTLGDIKAIFFYLSVLPVFIELTSVRWPDVVAIAVVTVVAVGGTKLLYALLSRKLVLMLSANRHQGLTRKAAGAALVGTGTYLVIRA
tara:strand:- start:11340 stop:11966 length:627 start_codon:yes stop_codon:yes gene_type:complete